LKNPSPGLHSLKPVILLIRPIIRNGAAACLMHNSGVGSEADMIVGVITTRDILSHPVTMICAYGILRYFFFIIKAVSPKNFFFTNLAL